MSVAFCHFSLFQTVAEGKFATDFDKTGMRFQDPTTLSWHFLTMAIKKSSLSVFKTAAVHEMSTKFKAGGSALFFFPS